MMAISYHSHPAPLSLQGAARDALAITYVLTSENVQIPLSYYGDMVWSYTPYIPHAARNSSEKAVDWNKSPPEWVASLKSAIAAFTHRKNPNGMQLDAATIPKRAITLNAFAKWCSASKIRKFQDVTAFDMARYLQKLRDDGVVDRTLAMHVALLRKVYEMRAYMDDSFTSGAVSAISFDQVGALWEGQAAHDRRTELIPLDEATKLFSAAIGHLSEATKILKLRDELDTDWHLASKSVTRKYWGDNVKAVRVKHAGYADIYEFESALNDIRTAAYIVLALTTGCRVHELGDIRVGCLYQEIVDGATYWWLKSATRKIGDGPERWLAPAIAEKAVNVLLWYSAPLRQQVELELAFCQEQSLQAMGASQRAELAVQILELERNRARLFLTTSGGKITSTDTKAHNKQLKAFAKRKGVLLATPLATHRFRRTYAVIVVHLNKGARIDLVTLQHHFKHASVLMTEWYATLSATDKELYDLIEDEIDQFDFALVDHWMETATPLGGGLGKRIKNYPGRHHQPIFFRTRREFIDSIREGLNIRSTGHSWCVADAQDCGGRGLFEAPRCDDCSSGVIDDRFTDVWRNLQLQHEELVELADIGPGGREKAKKVLAAADKVLAQLAPMECEIDID